MTVHARYRTLTGNDLGEETMQVTPDNVEHLLTLLSTTAPFGVTLTTYAQGVGDHVEILSQLVAGITDDRAALHYTDENGSWYSQGPTPDHDGPVYAEIDFPDHTEIPVTQLHATVMHYCRTGARPDTITWQPDPYAITQ